MLIVAAAAAAALAVVVTVLEGGEGGEAYKCFSRVSLSILCPKLSHL